MATWGYVAVDKSGKEVKGSKDANTSEQVVRELKNQGFIVLEVKEQSVLTKDIDIDFSSGPDARDLAVFCRSFASITRAGVSIIDTMNMLADQTENKKLQKALYSVRASVEKGESFASSLAEHPNIFPELLIHMAQAGEASGSLDVAMDRMAVQFERNAKTQALVKKAMIYPIVVAVVALVVVIVMLVMVIPKYVDMFDELGTELPGITVAVMNMSYFIRDYWYILLPAAIALVIFIRWYAKTDSGKHVFGKLALKIPMTKNLTTKTASALMARTLSTLLSAGVPMVEAIDIVSETMTNVWFKEALKDAVQQVMIGSAFSTPLRNSGLFPPMVYHMVGIGEEAGSTEEMLDKLADYYEEEVEMAIQSFMAALEPMIIIVLAGIVGVLIAACMAPMVSMYAALDNL